jgi:hypothetical protein
VIATDPETITRVQGVGFSSPKTRVVTEWLRSGLTRIGTTLPMVL